MMRLPWQRPLPSNCVLYIQQLWASGGRTREPILLKFGTQPQIRTTMTVTWSNIEIFKIQNGGRLPCWKKLKCHNSPTNWPTGMQLWWSHPIIFSKCPPCCGSWQRRGALNILQLDRTREPILMKFGKQQLVRTTLAVSWSNIKIFKIQNGGRPPCWKYSKCRKPVTRLPIDRLWRNLGRRIPSCSRHVRHVAVATAH